MGVLQRSSAQVLNVNTKIGATGVAVAILFNRAELQFEQLPCQYNMFRPVLDG